MIVRQQRGLSEERGPGKSPAGRGGGEPTHAPQDVQCRGSRMDYAGGRFEQSHERAAESGLPSPTRPRCDDRSFRMVKLRP